MEQKRDKTTNFFFTFPATKLIIIMSVLKIRRGEEFGRLLGGSVGVFMSAADIIAPSPYYQSFEDYKVRHVERSEISGIEVEEISEEELKEQYEKAVADHKARQVERAKNSLIKSFGWIIIPLAVFIVFQRRLTYEKSK